MIEPQTLKTEFFRTMADNMIDLVALHELDGTYLYVSPSASSLLGYTPEELVGSSPYLMFHPEDIAHIENESHRQALAGKRIISVEYRIRKKDGSYIWFDTNTMPITDVEGKVIKLQTVSRDITEKKNNEMALQKLNLELGLLNNQKDKLLSVISHDLRGPFLSFQGLFDLVLKDFDSCSKEELKSLLNGLKKNCDNTFVLLQDLLLWSRNQFDAIQMTMEPLDVQQASDEVINCLNGQATEKSIEIINHIPKNLKVVTDRQMFKTIIRNLISNALKFSNCESEVILTAKTNDNFVEFTVEDFGNGIAPEAMESILSVKEIHTTAGTEGEKGFGLGLGICRDFINKLGGHIFVDSELNIGSRFTFTLPV
ncbi:PAS domain S-box protein [Fulvivirga sp. RKSG066]|uniref:PAS domain-containing sensor histidine kinase n=1 Tax=Fulvivirga aurantia TaxID=2529383 RepID=UPI0012BC0586|nr:PAS domain-containing sensor histidine kinase [Fulvivirga aurantia]MTI22582.1 PAS domain S-box protein [Fulvivirga aurantia]